MMRCRTIADSGSGYGTVSKISEMTPPLTTLAPPSMLRMLPTDRLDSSSRLCSIINYVDSNKFKKSTSSVVMLTHEKTSMTPCRGGCYSSPIHPSLGCRHSAASAQVDSSTSPFGANNHDGPNDASTPLSPPKFSQLNSNNRKRRGRPNGKSKKYADLSNRESG